MVHEIALTIKPTMSCNMRCKHCFNGDDLNASEMIDIQKVFYFVEAACKEYSDIKITFHGGEPTLAGIDFYNKVFKFLDRMKREYNVIFSINFTTNGLLLSEDLMELLIRYNALINVSFDGPYNHILRQHGDTVYQRICRIREKGGRVRAFCTISKDSFQHLLEIYKWFNERKIDFKILPIEPRGYAAIDRSLLMDTDEFVDTLSEVYQYWLHDKECRIKFYTFEEFVALRREMQFKPFWFKREIALNPDGKIYPFGRPNDVQFCLGEPSENMRINDCFTCDEYERMLGILEGYRKSYCKLCSSRCVCNGVCVCMSYMYVQEEELLKYSCNQSNRIFSSILEINEKISEELHMENKEAYSERIIAKFDRG